MKALVLAIAILLTAFSSQAAPTADFARTFEDANRLYEQGKFADAAAAYQQLVNAGQASAGVYYNLGNAWFKAGQNGRAIAAYRQALRLTPRDPNVQFNLQFVRKRISGDEQDHRTRWERLFGNVTLNEWTILTAAGYWLLCLLLAGGELRSSLRRTLRPYAIWAGVATLLFGSCLGVSSYISNHANDAVVVVPNAVVRRSPLEESKVAHQLPDGSEVSILDTKESMVGDRKQLWLQVQGHRGVGWLQRGDVIILKPANESRATAREPVVSTS